MAIRTAQFKAGMGRPRRLALSCCGFLAIVSIASAKKR
jgi:hypothetical protein